MDSLGLPLLVVACLVLLVLLNVVCNVTWQCRCRCRRARSDRSDVQEATAASLPLEYAPANRLDDDVEAAPECVVCLSRLKAGEVVRRLPNCTHMFHGECVDLWLSSHGTCPVCRSPAAAGAVAQVAGGRS